MKQRTILTTLLMTVAALTIAPTPVSADYFCEDEDQSGGWGGQDVYCSFECDAGSTWTLSVRADDTDAQVTGSASCGNGPSAYCSGTAAVKNHCDGAGGPASDAGQGDCEGSSSETYDSGLWVQCIASSGGNVNLEETCNIDPLVSQICGLISMVEMTYVNGQSTGRACNLTGCTSFTPACDITEGILACRIN